MSFPVSTLTSHVFSLPIIPISKLMDLDNRVLTLVSVGRRHHQILLNGKISGWHMTLWSMQLLLTLVFKQIFGVMIEDPSKCSTLSQWFWTFRNYREHVCCPLKNKFVEIVMSQMNTCLFDIDTTFHHTLLWVSYSWYTKLHLSRAICRGDHFKFQKIYTFCVVLSVKFVSYSSFFVSLTYDMIISDRISILIAHTSGN